MLDTKQADSGTVRLLGKDPKKKRRALFQRIGVQFQEGDYQKEIRVSELCEETASLDRSPADSSTARNIIFTVIRNSLSFWNKATNQTVVV